MARIIGIELQDKWRLDYALTRIKGIGWPSSELVLDSLKIDGSKRVSDLTAEEISRIATKLDEYQLEGELARRVRTDISRLAGIGAYRGVRHTKNLPVRGQRTRTNARTKRGKRKTIGAFKKEVLSKMDRGKPEEQKTK